MRWASYFSLLFCEAEAKGDFGDDASSGAHDARSFETAPLPDCRLTLHLNFI